MSDFVHPRLMTGECRQEFDDERSNATVIDLAVRLALLGLLCYLALLIVSPLSGMLIWSIVLAVAIYPTFDWLATILGGRCRLAAMIITVVAILIVLGPVTWLALSLVESLQVLSRHIEAGELSPALSSASVKSWPVIGGQLYDLLELATTNFAAAFAKVAPQLKPLGGRVLSAAGAAGTGILTFVAAIIIAGFLLVPGPTLVDGGKAFARRIIVRRGNEFVELAGATIRKVSRGVIGIAALQSVLAGIGLVTADVRGAGLITFLVLILGIVQIGPGLVLIPVVVWSWIAMETTAAVLFTAYMVPVGLVDNVLRPIVMGRGLVTPMPVIFTGLIGGVIAFGLIGIFIGPIVLAVAWGLLVAWVHEVESNAPQISTKEGKTDG